MHTPYSVRGYTIVFYSENRTNDLFSIYTRTIKYNVSAPSYVIYYFINKSPATSVLLRK